MAEGAPEPQHGLVVRLVANVIVFMAGFGALRPLAQWGLGDSRGFSVELKEGLITGAVCGVLMTFLGDPLARWLDRLLRRRKVAGPGK